VSNCRSQYFNRSWFSHTFFFLPPQELKKSGTWKPQLELYKKQISELHQRLNEETKKADKSDFECRKMQEKLNAIQREKEVSGYGESKSKK
jgi:hypothetical protein